MKNKMDAEWQKAWLTELDEKTPPLADFVKNEPLPAIQMKKASFANLIAALTQRRIAALATACVMIVMIVAVTLIIRTTSDDHVVAPPVKVEATIFAVEINPSSLFSVNADGKVSSVVALDGDADAVMAQPDFAEKVIGRPINAALTAYTDMCARLGFINYSADAVRISGIVGDERLESARDALTEYFKSRGILAVIDVNAGNVQSFGAAYGIDFNGKTPAEVINNMTASYSERYASEKSIDELRAEYENEIVSDALDKYIKEAIYEQLELLAEILPPIVINGIKECISGNLSGNRDAIINAYKDIFDDEDSEKKMENLTSLPETVQQYKEKMTEYTKLRSAELAKQNKSEYEAEHEAISDEAYDVFIQSIINGYGSVGAYFDSKK